MRAPSSPRPTRLAATALAAALALTACGAAPTPGRVLRVVLEPGPALTVPVGSEVAFTATVDVDGAIDASVAWSATCGSVDADGAAAVFTAPLPPVACTVSVASVADPARSAATVVTADSGPPGVLRHAAQFGTSSAEWVNGVAVRSRHEAVFVGGTRGDLAGPGANLGDQDAFVVWFDARAEGDARVVRVAQFGTAVNDFANAVAVDAGGAVWVSGQTNGTLPGQTSTGGTDAFLARFEPDGTLAWTRQFGGPGTQTAPALALDGDGSAVVTGWNDGGRPFLQRFAADGTDLGSAPFGPTNASVAAIAFAPDGDVLVAGSSQRAFPDEAGLDGFQDAFVAKVALDGTVAWSRTYPVVDAPSWLSGVGAAADGRVVAAGYVNAAFAGDDPIAGASALLVVGLDADGTERWRRVLDTDGRDDGYAVAVDGSGHALVVGSVGGDLLGNEVVGGDDAFVVKLDPEGDVVWARTFGSVAGDYATAVAVDEAWNVWVAGATNGDLDDVHLGGGDPVLRSYTP